MIRPITPEDSDEIIELTAATGVFKPLEIATLREVLKDYHKEDRELGHRAFAWEDGGRIIGYIYFAPTPMTERTWHLYWIVVDTRMQGRGLGAELLRIRRERHSRITRSTVDDRDIDIAALRADAPVLPQERLRHHRGDLGLLCRG